jgi:hypothetical protein
MHVPLVFGGTGVTSPCDEVMVRYLQLVWMAFGQAVGHVHCYFGDLVSEGAIFFGRHCCVRT